MVYKIDPFLTIPDGRPIEYSFIVDNNDVLPVITFNPDMSKRKFKFFYDSDMIPAGVYNREYTITVIATGDDNG